MESIFEKEKLLKLQEMFKNNQIDEDNLSKEDINKLNALYDEQIKNIKEKIEKNILDTENYKRQIIAMKSQIKK